MRLLSQNEPLADAASPVSYASADDPPFLIYHGTGTNTTGDGVVPWQQSQAMNDALAAVGVPTTLHLVANAGHDFNQIVTQRPTTNDEILRFLNQHLRDRTVADPPRGIYVSGGPTTGAGSGSVTQDLVTKPFIDGFLVRVGWETLEPVDDQFSWTALDAEIAEAAAAGKKVSLGIVNGLKAPNWLFTSGAQGFNYNFHGTPETMPVPWDARHLAEWTELIGKVGERYYGNPAISLVHITNSTGNGFEMQLPSTPADVTNWNAIGYTATKVVDSWKTCIEAFVKAFPLTPMDVELHPVLNTNDVPNGVMNYAWDVHGTNLGAFASWWSQNNTTVYSGPWQLLQQADAKSFQSVQFVTNTTTNPNGFGTGGFQGAIDLARSVGVRYMEIWDTDLKNTALESTFTTLASLLRGTAPRLAGSSVNDGNVQRSRVQRWAVTFDMPVSFPSGLSAALQLTRTGSPGTIPLAFTIVGTTVSMTPLDANLLTLGQSLKDGRYQLTIVGSKIRSDTGRFDGNNDGLGGDNQSIAFHALFGDLDGNATVDGNDFAFFGTVFGQSAFAPDFDGNGTIDGPTDFAEFGMRFGITV